MSNQYKTIVVIEPLKLTSQQVAVHSKDLIPLKTTASCICRAENNEPLLRVRNSGPLQGQAIWLNPEVNWQINWDTAGFLVLVPTEKI